MAPRRVHPAQRLQIIRGVRPEDVPRCCKVCGRPVYVMQVLRGVSLDDL